MLPVCLFLALVNAQPPSPGPTPPAPKGLVKPMSYASGVKGYVDWSLREMGQAVVVVEGELPLPIPKVAMGLRLFDGKVKLFRPNVTLPSDLPVAPWMDLNRVGPPGNPASKTVPLGWGY